MLLGCALQAAFGPAVTLEFSHLFYLVGFIAFTLSLLPVVSENVSVSVQSSLITCDVFYPTIESPGRDESQQCSFNIRNA